VQRSGASAVYSVPVTSGTALAASADSHWQVRAVHPLLLRYRRWRLEPHLADSSGLGYHAGFADVSLTYRYLSVEQGSSAVV
jgi:hypothetical protein